MKTIFLLRLFVIFNLASFSLLCSAYPVVYLHSNSDFVNKYPKIHTKLEKYLLTTIGKFVGDENIFVNSSSEEITDTIKVFSPYISSFIPEVFAIFKDYEDVGNDSRATYTFNDFIKTDGDCDYRLRMDSDDISTRFINQIEYSTNRILTNIKNNIENNRKNNASDVGRLINNNQGLFDKDGPSSLKRRCTSNNNTTYYRCRSCDKTDFRTTPQLTLHIESVLTPCTLNQTDIDRMNRENCDKAKELAFKHQKKW